MKRAAKGGEPHMKILERAIVYPLLIIVISVGIGIGITYLSNQYDAFKRPETKFAMDHPELIRPVMDKLASGEAQLKHDLTKAPEPTAQDQLVAAVAKKVDASK